VKPPKVPETVSYLTLLKIISPKRTVSGELDWGDRCECKWCHQERHQMSHRLYHNAQEAQKLEQEHNCPDRFSRKLEEKKISPQVESKTKGIDLNRISFKSKLKKEEE